MNFAVFRWAAVTAVGCGFLVGACGSGTPAAPSGSAAPASSSQAAADSVPCEISQVLSASCQSCHGAAPINGAPMPLVTLADLTAPGRSDSTRKTFELVAERVQDRARPMPPDPTKRLSDHAIAMLQTWASSGAPAGAACAGPASSTAATAGGSAAPSGASGSPGAPRGTAGASESPATGSAGSGAVAAAGSGETGNVAGSPAGTAGQGSVAPADASDIENCYTLRAHGAPTPGDQTRYSVATGETYASFIFKAPWTTPVQGLRFKHMPDNEAVLHHWLLYSETAARQDGEIESCGLGGVTGLLCGQASTRSLITGWAPGRGDFQLPPDVGLELPGPGSLLAVEVHYYNSGTAPTEDQTGVEVCVTSKFRPNTASVTWLGTHQINLAPHAEGTASGTCTPLRQGMNATDPIHVLYSWPHMHKLGHHLKTVVNRAAGGSETMYDGEFNFNFQVLYDTPVMLLPGDSLTTTCSFNNTTDGNVTFGQSTDQEMCYNFTYAWPAHALDNPGAEIGGATNNCLQ